MLATCEHCGRQNEVPDFAENTQAICKQCGQPFFAISEEERAADRRSTKLLLTAVLLVFALMALLLFSRSGSGGLKTARQTLVGSAMAGRLEGNGNAGDGEGEGNANGDAIGNENSNGAGSGSGSARGGSNGRSGETGLPDPLATNSNRTPDRSIGRLPQTIGERKAGDEMRSGAAGTDDPGRQIGNSPTGQITNAPSAGGNPGNSDRRNSVETPGGNESLTGRAAGGDASALTSTNSRNTALLLDDFSERLRQAGARSGDLQISLEWKNVNDLDLHVIDPRGDRIFYNNRVSESGGHLDVDMNVNQLTARPVENIYWPERGAPRGTYHVEVVHFANHGARDPTEFTVRVVNKGKASYYRGRVSFFNSADRARVRVCTFTVQ